MNKKKVLALTGAIVVGLSTVGGYWGRPALEAYLTPLVAEKVNTELTGQARYASLQLDWTGDVVLQHVAVSDQQEKTVLTADSLRVDLSLLGVLGAVTGLGSPENIVEGIVLHKPEVYLQQAESKGVWNVETLLKPSADPKKPFAYRGYVQVEDGTVHVTRPNTNTMTVQELQAKVQFQEYPTLAIVASGKVEGQQLQIAGNFNTSNKDFSLMVRSDRIALTPLARVVPLSDSIQIEEGAVTQLQLTVSQKDHILSLDGGAQLRNVAMQLPEYHVQQGQAKLAFKDGRIQIDTASADVNGQSLYAAGHLDIHKPGIGLGIEILAQGADLAKLAPQMPVAGLLQARVRLGGTWERPEISGSATVKDAAYEGQRLAYVSGQFTYANQVLAIEKANIGTSTGYIAGDGWFNWRDKSFSGSGTAHAASLGELGALFGQSLDGVVNGDFYIRGTDGHLSSAQAFLEGEGVTYQGYYIDRMDVSAFYEDGRWWVPHIIGTIGDGAFAGTLSYEKDTITAQLSGNAIPLGTLLGRSGIPIYGNAAMAVNVQGDIRNPKVQFQLGASQGAVKGIAYETLDVFGELQDHVVTIQNARMQASRGTYTGHGTIPLTDNQDLNLDVDVREVRLEEALANYLPKMDPKADIAAMLTGWASNQLHIGGTWHNPHIEGSFTMHDGSLVGELVQQAHASYRYHNGIWQIQRATLEAYDSLLAGEGTLAGDVLDFQIHSRDFNLGRFIRYTGIEIDGGLDIDGHIQGRISNPNILVQTRSRFLRVNGQELENIDGTTYIDTKVLRFEDFSCQQGGGTYTLNGGYRFGDQGLFGTVKAERGDIAKLFRMVKLPIYDVEGALSGRIDLSGSVPAPSVTVRGTVSETTIGGERMGDATIDASLQRNNVRISTLKIPMGKGFLAAQGNAKLDGEASLQVVASQVPIHTLAVLSGHPLPITGTLEGIVNVTGKTQSPTMQLSAAVHKLTYNNTSLDHIYALATMQDGLINVNQILAERGQYKAKMYGKVPLKAFYSQAEPGKDNSLDLTLDLEHADLGAIPLFVPYVSSGTGETKGRLKITGTANNVAVNGKISVADGTLTWAGIKEPLTQIHGEWIFTGQETKLNLASSLGKGTVTLDGHAKWNHNNLLDYGAEANASKATVTSPIYTGPVNAHIQMYPSPDYVGLPYLGGHLDLSGVTLTVPMELLAFGESESTWNAALDLQVDAGSGVRLYNSLLYDLDVVGRAHFGGTVHRPHTEGRFSVSQGSVKYLNNRFEVAEGLAEFNQPGAFMPSIKFKANTTVQDYRIALGLTGPATHMDLSLSSEPALSEQQIISLLTVRSLNFNDLGAEKNALSSIVSAGLQMALFGKIENTFKDTLGLDRFQITPTYLDPYAKKFATKDDGTQINYYSLEVAKTLFPNFSVSFGTGLNYQLSKFGLAYKVSRHVDFDAWMTTDHNAYMGFQYKYRF